MAKIDDMILFVQVIRAGGLAAAGRQIGLSPASMTARINALEKRYNTRLLNRSTRSISLTAAGQRFYDSCLRVVEQVFLAEASLSDKESELTGTLRITASSDFGRQYVSPALSDFVKIHPKVIPFLYLTDITVNLVEEGFDLGVRLGNLVNSSLVAKPLLTNNKRVLCASPEYIKKNGTPETPDDLINHQCLVMQRMGEPRNHWSFSKGEINRTIKINTAMTSNDGAIIREWAVAGCGVTIKSYWDVVNDLEAGRLVSLLNDYIIGLNSADTETVSIQLVYPSRKYVPRHVQAFIELLSRSVG